VDQYIVIGSPLGLFLALRKVSRSSWPETKPSFASYPRRLVSPPHTVLEAVHMASPDIGSVCRHLHRELSRKTC